MSGERGVSATEVALMLPFLLMVTMGIVDLGRIMYFQMGVQEAVQEGAAYASIEPDDPSGIVDRTVEATSAIELTSSDVVVTCPSASSVTVTADFSLPMLTPFVDQMIGGGFVVTSSATTTAFTLTETCVAS